MEDVDLFIMYVNEEEKKYAAYLTQELRLAGFIVETEYTGRGLKGQFKSVDRFNAKYLMVFNDEDLQKNEVVIKDNATKEEERLNINNIVELLDTHM